MVGALLISQGEIVGTAFLAAFFSWHRLISARALDSIEPTESPFCQGISQQTQLTGVWWPRGLPPSTLGAIKGLSLGFKAFAPTLRLFLAVRPDFSLEGAFALQSPLSVGGFERGGLCKSRFPSEWFFCFAFQSSPRGGRWGRKGIWLAAEHERKRSEKAWRPSWGGRRNGGREQKAKKKCK